MVLVGSKRPGLVTALQFRWPEPTRMNALAQTSAAVATNRLLLVDDEENILRSIKRVLRRGNWQVETASDGQQALEVFRTFQPAVVISDFRMPGMNGVEFLSRVKELAPKTQRIMLTGHADQQAIEEAINRSEIFRFISKPWNDQQLVLTVTSAFEQFALAADNARLYQLTQEQNESLRDLNADLETRVSLRTHALAVAKQEWELTFDSLATPVVVVGQDLVVRRANQAAANLSHRVLTELRQRPELHPWLFGSARPDADAVLAQAFATGQVQTTEVAHQGRTYVLSVYPMVSERRAVCAYRDVTEERELNRRMLETEKMAAVGQLAGGVAHEINNPLGGILAFAQLMKRDPGRTPEDQEALDLIEESALRCKRIVDSLLRFSRRSRDEDRRPFDVSRCVDDAVFLFRAQLKSSPRARLEVQLASGLPEVHGDPAQLGQVVLNLLQNGLQALPQREGMLRVETGTNPDGQVFLRVADTGSGIAAEHLPKIFEPSFTTKPPGEGTGLGLAIAYRIVQDHHGHFTVQTEVGRGSTFTVNLPIPLLNSTERNTP